MNTLLLIADDWRLTSSLSDYLTDEGFFVDKHHHESCSIAAALMHAHDLVILDVRPVVSRGLEILRRIRLLSSRPVVLLTPRNDHDTPIVAFQSGADDCVTSPINPPELIARLRAILRRGRSDPTPLGQPIILRIDDVLLDSTARSVRRGGDALWLTPAEFEVLRELMAAAGTAVRRETLAELGLPRGGTEPSVDKHVAHLRRKLGPSVDGATRITSVRRVGYRYELPKHSGGAVRDARFPIR